MTKRGADHAPAVVHFLVVTLDVPGRVVGDDEDRLSAVAHGRIDFHGIDAECAVAVDGDDLPARKGKGGGDGERYSDA